MGLFIKSRDDWKKKAVEKNEELVKISQDIKFYQDKTALLAKNITLLQNNPEENEARIDSEAKILIGHNKKLVSLYADMTEVLEDIEKIDKKLSQYKDTPK